MPTQEQLKGKERRRPAAFSSSGTPGGGGGGSGGSSSSSYRSLSTNGAVGARGGPSSTNITAAAAAAARARAAAGRGGGGGGGGASGGASLGPQRLPSAAAGASGGSDKDRAEEQRRKDLAVAMGRAGSSPSGVQTFTLDHFVQGVVEWDIFGELHAEANGSRRVTAAWEEARGIPNISVPNSFRSAQEYARVWTPLLVREVRAQTLSELCGSDGWQKAWVLPVRLLDTSNPTTSRADLKLADVHPEFGELTVGKKIKDKNGGSPQTFIEHELVLFMVNRDDVKTAMSGKGSESPSGFLGVVSSSSRTREGLAVRVSIAMLKQHRPKDRAMHIMSLGSLRPTLREYDSITGLGRVMLRSNLLTGKPGGSTGNLVDNLGRPFVKWLDQKFNA
ncbi:unnamed protein product [Hapterophycus canaliculatus]